MPGRSESALGHRYGFNGKELDNEVKGGGVQYDYGFRIYDSRVARFLSVDPLTASYPWYTPYQFASDTPIAAIDLDGIEKAIVINSFASGRITKTKIVVVADGDELVNLKTTGHGISDLTLNDILE